MDVTLHIFGIFDREIEIGVPDEKGRLEILRIHTKNMKLAEDVDLQEVAYDTHGYAGADFAPFTTEADLQCLRAKIDVIDIEDETIDAVIFTNDYFQAPLRQKKSSSLRETVVEILNAQWEDSRLRRCKKKFARNDFISIRSSR